MAAAAALKMAAAAALKMASAVRVQPVQARGIASTGFEAWGKASQISQDLQKTMSKEMCEVNWSEAKNTCEKMSKLMKEPHETLSLADIKISQLEADLCQLKTDMKFYSNFLFAVHGVFACFLMGIPTQIFYGDLKVEAEVKHNKESLESLWRQGRA